MTHNLSALRRAGVRVAPGAVNTPSRGTAWRNGTDGYGLSLGSRQLPVFSEEEDMADSVEARVAIVCGSRSDFPTMEKAVELLSRLDIPCELRAISAHRAPDLLFRFVTGAEARGVRLFIAGAGGAAHLAGVIAAKTPLPVIGVPMPTSLGGGLDSLLSMVQMPRGVPVACVAVGGAENAAILAAEILAISDPAIRTRLDAYRANQTRAIEEDESNVGV